MSKGKPMPVTDDVRHAAVAPTPDPAPAPAAINEARSPGRDEQPAAGGSFIRMKDGSLQRKGTDE